MEALQSTFDFDESTLRQNQAGHITDAQRKTLDVYLQNAQRGSRAAFFASIVTLAVFIGGWAFSNPLSRTSLQAEAISFSLIGGILVLFLLYNWITHQRLVKRIRSAEVLHTQGSAKKSQQKLERIRMTAYYVQVGAIKFQLDGKKQWDALDDGRNYLVHYIDYPPTQIILALELID